MLDLGKIGQKLEKSAEHAERRGLRVARTPNVGDEVEVEEAGDGSIPGVCESSAEGIGEPEDIARAEKIPPNALTWAQTTARIRVLKAQCPPERGKETMTSNRPFVIACADAAERWGVSAVADAAGVSSTAITRWRKLLGRKELPKSPPETAPHREQREPRPKPKQPTVRVQDSRTVVPSPAESAPPMVQCPACGSLLRDLGTMMRECGGCQSHLELRDAFGRVHEPPKVIVPLGEHDAAARKQRLDAVRERVKEIHDAKLAPRQLPGTALAVVRFACPACASILVDHGPDKPMHCASCNANVARHEHEEALNTPPPGGEPYPGPLPPGVDQREPEIADPEIADPEIAALLKCIQAFNTVDRDTAHRMLSYLDDRFVGRSKL
jgi:hypothetical protein